MTLTAAPTLLDTASTLSPTFNVPGSSRPKISAAEAWILVAVFIFLFGISHYIARFLMAFLNGLPKVSPDLINQIKTQLKRPLAHGLRVAFLTLALYFLPVYVTWVLDILFYALRLYQWIVIFFACWRVSRLIVIVADYFMVVRGAATYVRKGVVEFLYIVRVVLLIIVFLLLASYYPPNASTDFIVSIFLSVNMVTATLVVMLAPLMRNLIAGLSILVDQQIKAGEVVSMHGICKIGRLRDLSLRQVLVESFEDGSLIHVPTITLLRSSVGKYDAERLSICARFPLKFDMPADEVRGLVEFVTTANAASKLIDEIDNTSAPHRSTLSQVAQVWMDENFCLVFESHLVDLENYDVVRTELMLGAMQLFQDRHIELRNA